GDAQPDAAVASLGTVPLAVANQVFRYCIAGGIDNSTAMLRYLSDTLLGTAYGSASSIPLPEVGIYHPDHTAVLDPAAWRQFFHQPDRTTVGIVFYRAHWVTGNMAPVDALIQALEARGLNVLAAFGPNLGAVLDSGLLLAGVVDLLITTTSFSARNHQHT